MHIISRHVVERNDHATLFKVWLRDNGKYAKVYHVQTGAQIQIHGTLTTARSELATAVFERLAIRALCALGTEN